MKSLLTLATLTLACATIVGCQSNRSSVRPSTPIASEALQQMRADFVQADPEARLGSVDAVLASAMYVTVSGVTTADFPIGTAVAIIDSNRQVVANGNVVRTFETSVHVHYELVAGQRAPQVGDVAVRFEAGHP